MIFGKSEEQAIIEKKRKLAKMVMGVKRFAFFPVRLSDKRFVWMESYYLVRTMPIIDGFGSFTPVDEKPVRLAKQKYQEHPYSQANIRPLRSYKEDCIARAAIGVGVLSNWAWQEKKKKDEEERIAKSQYSVYN